MCASLSPFVFVCVSVCVPVWVFGVSVKLSGLHGWSVELGWVVFFGARGVGRRSFVSVVRGGWCVFVRGEAGVCVW